MSAEEEHDLRPEIAHVLTIDVVGYSKLLVNEQVDLLRELSQVVRKTACFQTAEAEGKLIRLPTGDGMCLLFFRSPEEPLQCALEISQSLQSHPHIRVRMGAHSGPVNQVEDVNDRLNVAGAGINIAQRVLDCGDAGHILLSKRLADDLAEYGHWRPYLHDLGECVVKHGLKIQLVNFHKGSFGNPQRPLKLQQQTLSQSDPRNDLGVHRRRLLRYTTLALALLALAAIAVTMSYRGSLWVTRPSTLSAIHSVPPDKSVVVLPFENLSDEKGSAYFAYGVQDEIFTDLGKVGDMKVIGPTSVLQYKKGAGHSLREVAQSVNVRYALKGSVQRSGERVRVMVQLIDARTDALLWGEHYDRDLSDVFAIQSEIAVEIASQLKAKLSPEVKAAIQQPPTVDLAANDLYVRAKALIARVVFDANGFEGLVEAASLLEQATTRDPSFFIAYCQLANAHDQIYFYGIDHTPERLTLANAALERAVHLRPDFGEAHLAAAGHYYYGYLDYDRAREELVIARRLLPNNPLPILLLGYIDRRQGHWDDSTHHLERVVELDPRNLLFLQQLARSYNALRQYPAMAAVLDRALALAPDDLATRVQRANIDLDWRADTRPMHAVVEAILAKNSGDGANIADQWMTLALCERDTVAAARALAAMTANGCYVEGVPFPRAWCEGVVARERKDSNSSRMAFTAARAEVEHIVRDQPDFAAGLSALAMIDAALGDKKNALDEGQRAVELLPISKDAIAGPILVENLAVVYAWTGEKTLAFEQLKIVASVPCYLSYGALRLHPYWDPLRDDPRFQQVVSSLAPKAQ